MEQGLGSHFSGDVREAWAAIYGTLADMMIGAAAGDSSADSWSIRLIIFARQKRGDTALAMPPL